MSDLPESVASGFQFLYVQLLSSHCWIAFNTPVASAQKHLSDMLEACVEHAAATVARNVSGTKLSNAKSALQEAQNSRKVGNASKVGTPLHRSIIKVSPYWVISCLPWLQD